LRKIGYASPKIEYVPCSGWTGANLIDTSFIMDWYKGPTLIEALDSLASFNKPVDKQLRLPIQDVYRIANIGTIACGRVETGILRKGALITFAPMNIQAECKSVELHNEQVNEAIPGDNVGFNLKNLPSTDIRRGCVASESKKDPASDTSSFTA